jgi:hypothetical protein
MFERRRARLPWFALIPAIVAALFALTMLRSDDDGLIRALPYFTVALLSLIYVVRPMFIVWALAFLAFLAYTATVLVYPLVDPANGPLSDWRLFAALGSIPTVLLWLSRPKPMHDS